jgi:5-(carboxyamino)imidazole ribonucleotide synthase
MTAILPGATIGFLGGGQLGRMAAMAARSMGYDVHVLDPDPDCPARAVSSKTITASFNDVAAAVELARGCSVITLEIEQISVAALDAATAHAPVRPGSAALFIIQDRLRQKNWLRAQNFPVGDFREADSAEALSNAITAMGPSIAKSCHGGYDGRGQVRLQSESEAVHTWEILGNQTCIVEHLLSIDVELSVLVARRPSGEIVAYPPSRNHHTSGVLTWAVTPARLPDELLQRATALALDITERLGIVGLLAVEFFCTSDGRLLVNELAPRPHNTYHHSERASATSQFEQLIRAVCDVPLGSTELLAPGAIVNLLGEVWMQDSPPDISSALAVSGTRLHLYGKKSARPGRKMGHLSAVGHTEHDALARVLSSYEHLSPRTAAMLNLAATLPPAPSDRAPAVEP